MADPLSITAGVLAVVTAAIQSTRSLCETVRRFKDRDRTLRRLQAELEDLLNILGSLAQAVDAETSMLTLLQGPIDRCSQMCHDFEESMKAFSKKPTTGFRDWAKMEFMRGDINEFINSISGYKSTISVGLGTITMQTSKVSHKVLQEYNEMIQNTAYDLGVHLQHIDDKLAQLAIDKPNSSAIKIDLNDERAVTEQCLRICEDARSYLESLIDQESAILQESSKDSAEDDMQTQFEAQRRTRQALDENQDSLATIIIQLQQRLKAILMNGDSGSNDERSRLQEDLNISKQCLEVCKVASEVSRQKVYRIGEVVAEGESDQVVVNSLADLFDVKKALSTGNSAQLVGSMTTEAIQYLAEQRYNSRFGAHPGTFYPPEYNVASLHSIIEAPQGKSAFSSRANRREQSPGSKTAPSPNEMKKRVSKGGRE